MVESVTASLAAGIIIVVIAVMALVRVLIVHPDDWHAVKPAPKSESDRTRSRRAG